MEEEDDLTVGNESEVGCKVRSAPSRLVGKRQATYVAQ